MVKGILSKRDTVLLLRSVERIRANPLRGSNQGKSRRILVRDPSTNYQWVVSLCVPPNRLQVCAEVNYSCYWRSCPKCFKKRTCRSYSGYHYSVDLLLPFSMAVRSESSWSSKWRDFDVPTEVALQNDKTAIFLWWNIVRLMELYSALTISKFRFYKHCIFNIEDKARVICSQFICT